MVFKKYPAMCQLEGRHGVELGNAYQNKESARLFTSYIIRQQRKDFMASFSYVHFFSFLMDGSTDAGNVEDELFVLLHCCKDDNAEEIKRNVRFFTVAMSKKQMLKD